MPSLVGLYAASRVSRWAQEGSHEDAMGARQTLIESCEGSSDATDRAIGAIKATNDIYGVGTFVGSMERPDAVTASDLMHKVHPTIPIPKIG